MTYLCQFSDDPYYQTAKEERAMIARDQSDRKIVTEYWRKPMPMRSADWVAVTVDYDGAPDAYHPVGYGATESEAIADLQEQLTG